MLIFLSHRQDYIMSKPPTPPPPPSNAEYVGIICNSWAVLELEIDGTTWLIADVRPTIGACITAQFISVHPKIKALIALCRHKGVDEKLIKRLNTFHQSLYGTAEKRNRAVHDAWMPEISPGRKVQLVQWDLGRGKDASDFTRPAPISDLIELNREINKRMSAFMKIKEALLSELRASQKIPPE